MLLSPLVLIKVSNNIIDYTRNNFILLDKDFKENTLQINQLITYLSFYDSLKIEDNLEQLEENIEKGAMPEFDFQRLNLEGMDLEKLDLFKD